MINMRITLGDLFGSGSRAVTRYTGTLLAVFVVQMFVTIAVMLATALVLAQAFAHLPMFDDAVDGDLVSLATCVRFAKANLLACAGIAFGALLLWQLASWFLVGGVYGVLEKHPEGRAETARTFGASGAATYLAYARLAVCSLPGWLVVLFVFATCSNAVSSRIEHALSATDLLAPLSIAILPAMVLAHLFATVVDYARVELTLRHASHDPSVVATYLRSLVFVIKRPLSLLHAGIGWLGFFIITLGYMYLAQGHPMYGAEGAVTLFVIRQGVALARMAIRFGVLAGQVDLGGSRPLPPRRVEVKAEPKQS
jgi:uncharacterized integral membrane protein